MPIAEDSAGGSPVPIPTNLTTNLTGEATGSGTLDYTTGDIDIAVTVVDNGHNHILENITDVQVNNAISGQILVYNGTVWANATNTSGITAIVQDTSPQLGGNLDLNGKNINGNGNINLADNYKLTLGTGNDLEISHDGVSSYIRDVGAGDLQIFASDDVYIRGQGTNTYMARFNESGAVTLYHNNVVRLITTDSGITVTDEVEAVEFIGKLRGPTKFKGKSGEALSVGDPVYISGISGNTTVVSKADANDASKMPAFGIIDASVSANASCQVLTFGEMHNLDTSAFSEGDELYVSNTGTLTTAIPSGESSQIQKIAKVTRSHASAGGIFIMGAGRSNAVPNLDNGDIFIGDGTNHATTTSLNTAVNALTLTNYLPLSGGAMTGNITTSGTFDGRDVSVDGAKLDGIATGADVTLNEISAGTNVTISAGGVISSTGSGGLAHVVDDTTPELGGNLSLNSHDITGTGNLNFTGNVTLSGTVDGRDVAADGTKLDGIEASADVTDTANVTAAGALMDSEVTNLAQVKAFDSSDYATAAQGTTADAALPKAGGTMTGNLDFTDSSRARFGASNDLVIFHNGSNSYIQDNGTGDLILRGSGNISLQAAGGTVGANFAAANAVTLNYAGNQKFATTSSGIDVTGNVFVNRSQTSGVADLLTLRDASAGAIYNFETYADPSFGTSNRLNYTGQYFAIRRSGTEQMRFTSSGIDVTGTVKADKMEVQGTSNTRQWLAGSSTNYKEIYAYDNSTFYDRLNSGNCTNYQWGVSNNIPIYTITNNSIKTTLLGNGNFGVGTTVPTSLLHLASTAPYITFEDTDNNQDWQIQATAWFAIRDQTANAERMRIDSSGRVGVGTTTTNNNQAVIEGGVASTNGSSLALKTGNGTSASVADLAFYGTFVSHPDTNQRRTADITSGYSTANWGTEYLAFGVGTGGSNDSAVVTTERMRISGNGNVGIGTTSPNHELHIESTSPTIRLVDTDGNNTIDISQSGSACYIDFDNTVRFRNLANAERFRIDSNGVDVTGGIDVANGTTYTTTGDFLAKVQQNSNASGKNGLSVMNAWASSTSTIFEAAMGWDGSAAGYYPVFTIDGLGKTTWKDNFGNVRATIDGSGLDVTGAITGDALTVDTTASNGVTINGHNNATTTYPLKVSNAAGSGNLELGTYGINNNIDLRLQKGGSTKLRVYSSGIDVTGNIDVSNALNVGGASPAGSGFIESTVVGSSRALQTVGNVNTTQTHIGFENPSGEIGRIDVSAFSVAYVTSSDYRLKTDIKPMQGSIDRVKALNPVNFEWTGDGSRVDGFIAHEAQEVVPEAISGEKDAMRDQDYVESEATGDIYTPAVEATYETIQVELTPAVEATYDEDGNELTPAVDATYEEQQQELTPAIDEIIHSSDVVEPDELEEGQLWRETTEKVMATRQVPDYQGIDQSKIVPLLTSALQDAIAKIEALETRLEALES